MRLEVRQFDALGADGFVVDPEVLVVAAAVPVVRAVPVVSAAVVVRAAVHCADRLLAVADSCWG